MFKKTALICGVTGGIGQAVAKQLLAEKIEICGVFNNPEKAKVTAKALGSSGLFLYQIDLTDTDATSKGLKKILTEHQNIGIVVFSVSERLEYKPFLETTWQDYAKHIDLQVKGLHNIVQGLKDQIKTGQGLRFIVLLTEACFGKPPAGMSAYVSAKYALQGMVKSMAIELAKYNCTVNLVSPGMVKTDLISGFPAKLVELQATNNPLKRIASPQDVANVVCFLAQEKTAYINGVNIPVNGGQVLS